MAFLEKVSLPLFQQFQAPLVFDQGGFLQTEKELICSCRSISPCSSWALMGSLTRTVKV